MVQDIRQIKNRQIHYVSGGKNEINVLVPAASFTLSEVLPGLIHYYSVRKVLLPYPKKVPQLL